MLKNIFAATALLSAVVLCGGAKAQQSPSQCAQNTSPNVQSGTSYTLSSKDNCAWIIFTNPGAVTVTLPAPGLIFAPGFTTNLLMQSGGALTLINQPDPSTGKTYKINGASSLTLASGQSVILSALQDRNWYALSTGAGNLGGMATNAANALLPGALDGLGIGPGSGNTYPLNLSALTALTFPMPTDWNWTGGGPLAGVFSSHQGQSALLGWARNDATPGNWFPVGVSGSGDLVTTGNQAFGIYGQSFLRAASGKAIGAEFTSWNWSGTPAGTLISPFNTVDPKGVNVTCGSAGTPSPYTPNTCSFGIYIGSNDTVGSPYQFNYGIWVSNALQYSIVLGTPGTSGAVGKLAFAGGGTGLVSLRPFDVNPTGDITIPSVSGSDVLATLGAAQEFTNQITIGVFAAHPTQLDVLGSHSYRGYANATASFRQGASSNTTDAAVVIGVVAGTGPYVAATSTGDGTARSLFLETNQLIAMQLDTAQNVIVPNGDITIGGLPTSAGSGGLYVCADNTGKFYKKSACP